MVDINLIIDRYIFKVYGLLRGELNTGLKVCFKNDAEIVTYGNYSLMLRKLEMYGRINIEQRGDIKQWL